MFLNGVTQPASKFGVVYSYPNNLNYPERVLR